MNGPGYVSESFWDSNTIVTLLLLLLMFIAMCLPAIVAYRNNDKKQMCVSILCGLFGMFLLIPWIISVVRVLKKYEMPKKEKGVVKPVIFMCCSVVLVISGGIIFAKNYVNWGILTGISLIIYGGGLLIVTFLRGKRYWGGLMVMAPLLVSGIFGFYRLYQLIAVADVGLILYNVAKSDYFTDVVEKSTETAKTSWAEQTILGAKTLKARVAEKKAHFQEPKEKNQKEGVKKMKLERCSKGHFYDFEKYGTSCPYCNPAILQSEQTSETPIVSAKSEEPVQLELSGKPELQEPEKRVISKYKAPVVGWLVCIEGIYKGESFALKTGRNFIGRAKEMDICLKEDNSIAEHKQAAVIYEPRSRQFIVVPGEVHELCYINNEVVLANAVMNAYDVLDMGNISMMLVPCCGKHFSWETGLLKESNSCP